MQKFLVSLVVSFIFFTATAQTTRIITTDITNFWKAYDKITSTKDSAAQYHYLANLYFKKATPGLKAMMKVREYTAADYIQAINSYPKFWSSIRKNTLRAKDFAASINTELTKLKILYPELKPASIYFTIGALRSNGTVSEGMVLVGAELALADSTTVFSEFPEAIATNRQKYFASNPVNGVVGLNVHEYIHTQQKPMVYNLLSEVIYEGVAEFVSWKVTGKFTGPGAIKKGQADPVAVRKAFERDMFNTQRQRYWLWSDAVNEFNERDMGYYIGFTLCELFYNKATDKKAAIKYLIGLDYTNEKEMEKFIDGTSYFSASLKQLYTSFENSRPAVTSISPVTNGSTNVSPAITEITLHFSEAMNTAHRGFDYGPLGESNVLRVKSIVGWSADAKSFTFTVELKPNQRYQSLVTNNFRNPEGIPLKPFLIDFTTREK